MIKFFRKIRFDLMEKNNTGKYLKYAIGETVLVVIGILIALSINNWNENKKTRNTEVKLLFELKGDLLKTKEDLLTDIDKSERILAATDTIYLEVMQGRKNNTDVILTISNVELSDTPLLFPKLSAYKSIQGYGVNMISNDSLRRSLTELYELQMARVKYIESYLGELHQTEIRKYLYAFAKPKTLCEDCISLNEQFAEQNTNKNVFVLSNPNTEFIHMLKHRFGLVKTIRNRYLKVNDQIDYMINIIDEEINYNHD